MEAGFTSVVPQPNGLFHTMLDSTVGLELPTTINDFQLRNQRDAA